jgi:hypothetical protein
MRATRAVSRLAIAGAATVLVVGCGSSGGGSAGGTLIPSGGAGGGGSSIQALLAGSVDKTEAAKNAKIHIDFSGGVAGQNISFGGDGIADFAAKKFQLSLTLPAAAGISGTLEERVIGKDFYLKLPTAAAGATGGKPWVKFDASELGASSKTGLNFTSQDPTQLLATLRGVSDSVTKVGTAQVRGVETTHYRAEVDLAKAVKESGADSSSLQEFTKSLGATTIPEDVYLDKEGLPRRFAVTINPSSLLPSDAPSAAASAAAGSSFTITVDFYDFGTTDTSGITAPPADQIGDFGSLLGGLGGGSGSSSGSGTTTG